MSALQKRLAASQIAGGLEKAAEVRLTAVDRATIDDTSRLERKYLVGVSKPIGVTVDFRAARDAKKPVPLALGAARGTSDGGFVWTAAVRSPGATAMRLRLSGVDLPPGTELYVYNLAGHAFGPYTGRGPAGDGVLYTNTVFGEQILLQLRAAAGSGLPKLRVVEAGVMGARFLAPRYGPEGVFSADDLDALAKASNLCSYNEDCVQNAACGSTNSAVNSAKDAVASILFPSGGGFFICTGGLIADSNTGSVIPYFLTAHHCISSSGEAAGVETYFDYVTSCSNPTCTQPYNNAGETVGSTIKATGSTGDFSLLQLSSNPTTPDGVATYLGWTTTAVANTAGVDLFRISHPSGAPQAYSEHEVNTNKGTCRTLPRGTFIYSNDLFGATEGGSSGSPVVNGAGQVVGQLYGACGTNVNDVCDSASNSTIDGAFAAYFSNVSSFLQGGGGTCGAVGSSCTSNSQCCSNSCKGKPGAKTCK
jgi:lysyl endopeptidase